MVIPRPGLAPAFPTRFPAGPGVRRLTRTALLLAAALLLALAPGEGLLLGLAALGLLALLRWPLLGLCAAAFGVPFGSLLTLPLDGLALTPTPLLLAAASLALLLPDLARGRLPTLPVPRALLAALALFLCALAASAWGAPEPLVAAVEIARWLEFGLALALAAGLAGRPRAIHLLLICLLLAGAAQALFGIWTAVARLGPEAYAVLGGRIHRAHGSFGQPNPFAGYTNMVWPLGAALLLVWMRGARTGRRGDHPAGGRSANPVIGQALGLAGALAAALTGLALLLSWSRGGWLAAAAGGAALGATWLATGLRSPRLRRRTAGLAGILVGLLLLGLAGGGLDRLPASVSQRLASIGQTERAWGVTDAEVTDGSFSTLERIAHWEAAVAMWDEAPWLGQGPGHYALAYRRVHLPRWSDPLGHAHNVYLNLLAETGIVGLAGFLLLWLSLLALALRAASSAAPLRAALGLGLVGILVATSVHSLLDNLFVHEMTVQLGLLAGLTVAAPRSEKPRP